ncbi:MAG: hypothetical protein P4L69_21975 [Desulfosporosinus sp.]|nr:hypothetical protein [Desulfosporosinus sp.]
MSTNTKTIIGYNLLSYPTLVVIALVLLGLSILFLFFYNHLSLEHKYNDWLFAKLPNWLRWILSLPVAILVCLVIQFVLSFTMHKVLGWSYQNEVIRTVVMIVSVISFIVCFFYCLPKYKSVFTVTASILLSIYFLFCIILGIVNGFIWDITYGISGIVCIYVAVKVLLNKDKIRMK